MGDIPGYRELSSVSTAQYNRDQHTLVHLLSDTAQCSSLSLQRTTAVNHCSALQQRIGTVKCSVSLQSSAQPPPVHRTCRNGSKKPFYRVHYCCSYLRKNLVSCTSPNSTFMVSNLKLLPFLILNYLLKIKGCAPCSLEVMF